MCYAGAGCPDVESVIVWSLVAVRGASGGCASLGADGEPTTPAEAMYDLCRVPTEASLALVAQ